MSFVTLSALGSVLLFSSLVSLTPVQAAQASTIEITSAEVIEMIRAGQDPIILHGYTIRGRLDLTAAATADQNGIVHILPRLEITESEFIDSITTHSGTYTVRFESPVDFHKTSFSDADFTGVEFASGVNFVGTIFRLSAVFTEASFLGDAEFAQVRFHRTPEFVNTRFDAEKQAVSFFDSRFCSGANFYGTRFAGGANFSDTHFEGIAVFQQAQFAGETFYTNAHFGTADQPHLANCPSETNISPTTVFDEVSLSGNVHFIQSEFSGDASFRNISFKSEQAVGTLDFTGVTFDRFVVNDLSFLNHLSGEESAQLETLAVLEANFQRQDNRRLDFANEIYYLRMQQERGKKSEFIQALEIVFLDLPFGYFVRPERTVLVMLFLILIFAPLYYFPDVLREDEAKKKMVILVTPPISNLIPTERPRFNRIQRLKRAVRFSIAVFTKVSWGTLEAYRFRLVVLFQWVLGVGVVACFLFSILKTNPVVCDIFPFC